jgi:predicted RNA-binding Zn-ribbon protein involved in translation (DUF1610 family)
MDELDRLFHELVRVLRDARPELLARPFEVAELIAYVPYRAVRATIGTETNDDYAHVIMRLLSGERGYLFADEMLQDDMRNELSSPNPNLAVYRSYLNARIALSQQHTRATLDALGTAAAVTSDAVSELSALGAALANAAAAIESTTAAPTEPAMPPAPAAPSAAPAPAAAAPRPHTETRAPNPLSTEVPRRTSRPGCKYCGHALPEGRDAQFCPNCGQNLHVRRCAACSSELEAGWKFCITCGRAAP